MRAERPDAVVHLAAEALVDVSLRDPGRFYRANLVGGINLLDAMVEAGSTRLVFSSTASTYGQPEGSPITEEMAGNPCNSYGESKWAFERALPLVRGGPRPAARLVPLLQRLRRDPRARRGPPAGDPHHPAAARDGPGSPRRVPAVRHGPRDA